MNVVRNTAVVVSLMMLMLVGHFALHRFLNSRPDVVFVDVDSDGTPVPNRWNLPLLAIGEGKPNRQVQQVGQAPTPVPAPLDAAPVEATDSESRSEPEDDGPDAAAVRSVIEQELAHASPEERDIWYEELKTLPAGVVRDLLQVRKQIRALPRLLGGMPEKLAAVDTGLPSRSQEINAEPASQKIRFQLPDQNSSAIEIEAAISQLRHNLTNSATPGFKRLRVSLVDAYGPSWRDVSSYDETSSTAGPEFQGEGCRIAPILVDMKQGQLKKTERQFDLAIHGEGFFVVRRGDKDYLTRCGSFTLDKNRHLCLVTANEDVVLLPTLEVPFGVREVQIAADGAISLLKAGETSPVVVGNLQLAQVPSPARLKPIGNSLFVTTPESGDLVMAQPTANGLGEIHQGFVEQSNVDFEKESEELQDLANILKSLPIPNARPATATKQPQLRPH